MSLLPPSTALDPSPSSLSSSLDPIPSHDLKKKKPGRSPSQIWTLLTDEINPQRKNAAACKHCKQQVLYYKKSEQAIRHLKKCSVFQSSQHQYAFIAQFQDVLPLYQQKISQKASSKKRQKAHAAAMAAAQVAAVTAQAMATNQSNTVGLMQHNSHNVLDVQTNTLNALAIQQGMTDSLMEGMHSIGTKTEDPMLKVRFHTTKERKGKPMGTSTTTATSPLSKAQQERFEEEVAMHAYVTGISFDAMEEPHLQRAMATLRSCIKLPEKKRMEEELMLRCYDKMHKRVWGYLTSQATRVCLKRDDWSHMNLYNTPPSDIYVTYVAMNAEKRFFLESEKLDMNAQYNSIMIAQDIKRVMMPILPNITGVVTGSTEFHARAWELLKVEYPTKFFYGCITHALHLAIMDIFGPERTLGDTNEGEEEGNITFPFQELVDFTNCCLELIAFFVSETSNIQLFDAETLQTMKSFNTMSSTMQWGTLAARFRVLLQNDERMQTIVNDPEFLVGLHVPLSQRSIRQSIHALVTSINWKHTLEKAINILTPIELILYKFQEDKAPISEVYFESKHLLTDFDAVFGLTTMELAYIKKVVTERWQYVLGEAHGLAFLLDPRYIGKSMTREYREQIEELIFNFPESDTDLGINEERKRAISAEYTDYVIYAKNQRANNSFKWEMLEKGTRTPLQFWQTEADEWPHLKQLALTLFSLAPSSVVSEKSLCKTSLVQTSRCNKLSFDDMRRLAFITINDSQFTTNRMNELSPSLPEFNLQDTSLSTEGMMMWMI